MDYGAIIAIFAFLGAIQLATKTNFGTVFCSFVAVGAPFLIDRITLWIYLGVSNTPILESLFGPVAVVTIIIQFVLCLLLFKKIQDDDSLSVAIGWSIGGLVIILMLVPFIVQQILT